MSEADDAQRHVAQSMPAMHSEVGQALSLLTDVALGLLAVAERQAGAMERIADRLDSLTWDPETAEYDQFGDTDTGGPELRVRRW